MLGYHPAVTHSLYEVQKAQAMAKQFKAKCLAAQKVEEELIQKLEAFIEENRDFPEICRETEELLKKLQTGENKPQDLLKEVEEHETKCMAEIKELIAAMPKHNPAK